MFSFQTRVHLESLHWLAPGEWAMLCAVDRHTTIFSWLHLLVDECKTVGILGDATASMLMNSISDARLSANDLNNYLFQEIPYPYVQVPCLY